MLDKLDSPIKGKWEAIDFIMLVPAVVSLDNIKYTDLIKDMDCVLMETNFLSNGKITLKSTVNYDIPIVKGEVILNPVRCGFKN